MCNWTREFPWLKQIEVMTYKVRVLQLLYFNFTSSSLVVSRVVMTLFEQIHTSWLLKCTGIIQDRIASPQAHDLVEQEDTLFSDPIILA